MMFYLYDKVVAVFFAAIFINIVHHSQLQQQISQDCHGTLWISLTNFDAWGATNTSTWHAGATSWSPGSSLTCPCPCPQDKRWKVKAACIDVLLPCLHQMFVWLPRRSQEIPGDPRNQWTHRTNPPYPSVKKALEDRKWLHDTWEWVKTYYYHTGSGSHLGESTSMYQLI